jgi:aconitase A
MGATICYFPPDIKTLEYMKMTGRSPEHVAWVEGYLKAQVYFSFLSAQLIHFKLEINCWI